MSRKKYNGDDLARIDKEIRAFSKSHKGELSDGEHKELCSMLKKRAHAMSDVLGVPIHSICEDD